MKKIYDKSRLFYFFFYTYLNILLKNNNNYKNRLITRFVYTPFKREYTYNIILLLFASLDRAVVIRRRNKNQIKYHHRSLYNMYIIIIVIYDIATYTRYHNIMFRVFIYRTLVLYYCSCTDNDLRRVSSAGFIVATILLV